MAIVFRVEKFANLQKQRECNKIPLVFLFAGKTDCLHGSRARPAGLRFGRKTPGMVADPEQPESLHVLKGQNLKVRPCLAQTILEAIAEPGNGWPAGWLHRLFAQDSRPATHGLSLTSVQVRNP